MNKIRERNNNNNNYDDGGGGDDNNKKNVRIKKIKIKEIRRLSVGL